MSKILMAEDFRWSGDSKKSMERLSNVGQHPLAGSLFKVVSCYWLHYELFRRLLKIFQKIPKSIIVSSHIDESLWEWFPWSFFFWITYKISISDHCFWATIDLFFKKCLRRNFSRFFRIYSMYDKATKLSAGYAPLRSVIQGHFYATS